MVLSRRSNRLKEPPRFAAISGAAYTKARKCVPRSGERIGPPENWLF